MIIKEKFGKSKVLLPVIHVQDIEQAMTNVDVATIAGCDGVWLINHSVSSTTLFEIKDRIREEYPNLWIGMNCLNLSPIQMFNTLRDHEDVNGVWVDNAEIDEYSTAQPLAEAILAARSPAMYFGGVAFKYQRQVYDLESATMIARSYVDVITTSGEGTGQAASVQKVERMYRAAYGVPIAIASGITVENVDEYLPYVDAFLVSTGINRNFLTLDYNKTRQLCEKIHNYGNI